MEEFSFWQEVAKQAIASAFAAAVLVVGAWVTFVRSLRENRRKQIEELDKELEKQRADRRERYVTETLVAAYRALHDLQARENPLFVGHDKLAEYRLAAEAAIRDIQLLGDKASAEKAQAIGMNPALLQDDTTVRDLFDSMRVSLRDRLKLGAVSGVPSFLRFYDEDRILAASDDLMAAFAPGLEGYKQHLQAQRGTPAGPPPAAVTEV